MNLVPRFQKATENKWCVKGLDSLQRGSENSVCEAVNVKCKFPWRPQDVRDGRTIRCWPKKAACTERRHAKRGCVCCTGDRVGRVQLDSLEV